MFRNRAAIVLALVASALSTGTARAQDDAAVRAALDKGMAHLRGRQDPAVGAWRDHWVSESYKTGETALTLLTLLKAGAEPGAPEIERGFAWLLEQPPQRIYEVSVAILALEARYTPEDKASIEEDAPLATQIRDRFKKIAPGRDRQWLVNAVEYLVRHQDPSGLWKYPFFGDADVSNAQFAILALKAAQRMGVKVSPEVYLKTAVGLIELQEQDGPEVASFSVPAADRPIKGLLDKRERASSRRGSRRGASGGAGTRTRGEGEELETTTRTVMKARGWGYKPGDGTRGSMTAAGCAMLVVCKSELEGTKGYDEKLGPKVDQALRDGAAWLATRFSVQGNPGADLDWYFYWLYTLERAGSLLGLDRFGAHDWYQEGANAILARQQGDGRFHHDSSGQGDGDLAGTCLAMLFLKRSTVPVIKRKRVLTGGGLNLGGSASGPQVTRQGDGLQVTFRFRGAPGQRVNVAGSFNDWSASANALSDPDGDGVFEATLTLGAGRHTYKFVVDGGSWRHDPENPKGEPDGHGGQNSVIE